MPSHPRNTHAVIVGAGTMGADVAVVLARGGCSQVTVVDTRADQRAQLPARVRGGLEPLGLSDRATRVHVVASLQDVLWDTVVLVIECITEQLAAKQGLFAELLQLVPARALITSNSSGIPISAIAQGLPTQERMLGLHFFMPAHLVPLV